MAKKRLSMADEMEFPNKTRQFLDFVGVTRNVQPQEIETTDQYLSLAQIHLPSQQPRRYFAPAAMDSLIASIREHGILQPLLVRPSLEDKFELLAGERRYRAAQALKLEKVPVLIRNLADQDAIQVALLENLQREDLNPVANLQKQGTEITNNVVRSQWELVEQIFSVIGRLSPDSFRSHRLPLLNLPEDVLHVLRQGKLEYTKARTIAQVKDTQERQKLLAETLEHNLSVREIKKRIHEIQPTKVTGVPSALPNRMKDVYRRVRQAKIWEDPKKAKTLEKLLGQLESLVE